jgi:aliphatic sulfonates family ABC transporter substrate-binding protein
MINMKRMKKKLVAIVLTLVVVLGVIGCGSTDTSQDTTNADTSADTESSENVTIRLAVQKSIYQPYLAEALGYFKDEFEQDGITVELVQFSLGPEVIEAIGSDQVDIGFLGDLPAFAGLANGGDYKIIGKYESDSSRGLIVRDDANITKLEDLKGKKLAVSLGSNLQPLAELYLADAGLTDSDVELVNLSLADITTSIVNGDVDAAVTDQPYISQAINNGGITQLLNSEGYKTYISPIIAQNSFTEKYPDLTARVLKVLQKAAQWKEENPDEAVQKAAEATGVEEEDVRNKLVNADISAGLSAEEIQALKDGEKQIFELDLIKEDLNLDDYIDTSFLETAGVQ